MPTRSSLASIQAAALAALLSLAIAELRAETRVYRCVTAEGGIEFSQRPCAGRGEAITIEDRMTGWTPALAVEPSAAPPKPKASAASPRPATKGETTCWNKRQQLEQVNRKLRQGYTPAKGVELRHKRRTYEEYLSRFCR